MSNVIHPLQISKDLVKIATEKGEIENFRIYYLKNSYNAYIKETNHTKVSDDIIIEKIMAPIIK